MKRSFSAQLQKTPFPGHSQKLLPQLSLTTAYSCSCCSSLKTGFTLKKDFQFSSSKKDSLSSSSKEDSLSSSSKEDSSSKDCLQSINNDFSAYEEVLFSSSKKVSLSNSPTKTTSCSCCSSLKTASSARLWRMPFQLIYKYCLFSLGLWRLSLQFVFED